MHTNYHTHTVRCGHAASCPDEAYVDRAVRAGFSVFGFSEHAPWSHREGDVGREWYADYQSSILALREKYRDRLEIPLGLECEYFPQNFSWLREQRDRLDYILLGVHTYKDKDTGDFFYGHITDPDDVKRYCECAVLGMESGLYDVLAHPDLFLSDYPEFDPVCEDVCREICKTAQKHRVIMEYNQMGKIKQELSMTVGVGYPSAAFWQIAAQYDNRVIIGLDAHGPDQVDRFDLHRKMTDELAAFGITPVEYIGGR